MIGTVVALQYGIQTVVKLVPVVGSVVGGLLSALTTWLIGALAIRHHNLGWKLPTFFSGRLFLRRRVKR